MKKLMRRFTKFFVVSAMVAAIAPMGWMSVNAEDAKPAELGIFTNPTSDSLNSVLDYGVFAKTYTCKSDMEANIAAYVVSSESNNGASTRTSWAVAGHVNYNYIHSFASDSKWKGRSDSADNGILIVGDAVTISYEYNNGHGLELKNDSGRIGAYNSPSELGVTNVYNESQTTYQIDFDAAFTGLEAYADAQYAKEDTGAAVSRDGNVITITCEEGNDVVNLSASDITNNSIVVVGNGTKNYALTINVTDINGNLSLTQPISIDGQRGGYGEESSRVLVNFGSGTFNLTLGEFSSGNILAPNASVTVETTHNGSIFASAVTNTNGEIHQSRFAPIVETPTEPETPVTPETPTEPETPVTPETPTEPETPVTPETPTEPETPVTPDTPTEPETPVTPDTPTEPETPVTPETPDVPAETTTETEVTTDRAETPISTDTEVTTVTEEETTPVTTRAETPLTGDQSNMLLYTGIFVAAVCVIGIVVIKKRKYSK